MDEVESGWRWTEDYACADLFVLLLHQPMRQPMQLCSEYSIGVNCKGGEASGCHQLPTAACGD